jgi:hypothetical protein
MFGKGHLRALPRLVSSDIRKVLSSFNETRQPITPASFRSTPFVPSKPELNVLVANSGIHRSSSAIFMLEMTSIISQGAR